MQKKCKKNCKKRSKMVKNGQKMLKLFHKKICETTLEICKHLFLK